MPDIFISSEEPKEEAKKVDKVESSEIPPIPKTRKERERAPGHTHNPLASYCYLPEKVDFENKDAAEKVILLLRKHPITNVGWVLIVILMLLAPSVLSFFPILEFLPPSYQFIAVLGWYLLTFAFALESFLTWFFNVYIVTDERVVDIDFVNLIYKEISDAKIDRIQDVTYKMGGVIRTILDYGDVFIETAGEIPEFEFLAVPHPDKVAKALQELQVQEEQEKLEGRVR